MFFLSSAPAVHLVVRMMVIIVTFATRAQVNHTGCARKARFLFNSAEETIHTTFRGHALHQGARAIVASGVNFLHAHAPPQTLGEQPLGRSPEVVRGSSKVQLCVRACVWTCVCVRVCVPCACVCVRVHVLCCVRICVRVCSCVGVGVRVYVYVCVCVCVCVWCMVCVCVCVCVYGHVCMYM
jgi:uncharacterized membrane protein YgcG